MSSKKPARRASLDHIPHDICCAADYERLAPEFISAATLAYISGGSADEVTLQRNRTRFAEQCIFSRPLRAMGDATTRLSLLGQHFKHPVMLAPVAYQALVHADAELASSAGAAAVDANFIGSTLSSLSLEQVAAAHRGSRWFQLYMQPLREHSLDLLKRAETAGYSALVITVDAPVTALRWREQRAGFRLPADIMAANLQGYRPVAARPLEVGASAVFQGAMAEAPVWDDLVWLKQQATIPVLLKGLLHPDDIAYAKQLGFDGVVVSNHGGRALDAVPASLDVLPAIRRRVGVDYPLLLDGGIRSGGDVFKALARGANAVLIGRLQVYALAVAGALGVAHMLQSLVQEFEVTMALAGTASLAAINEQCLFKGEL